MTVSVSIQPTQSSMEFVTKTHDDRYRVYTTYTVFNGICYKDAWWPLPCLYNLRSLQWICYKDAWWPLPCLYNLHSLQWNLLQRRMMTVSVSIQPTQSSMEFVTKTHDDRYRVYTTYTVFNGICYKDAWWLLACLYNLHRLQWNLLQRRMMTVTVSIQPTQFSMEFVTKTHDDR